MDKPRIFLGSSGMQKKLLDALSSYSPLLGSEATANAIMVRYEELASDPRKVLLDLARETGLAISLGHLEKPVWLAADARHDASWTTELEGRGASPTATLLAKHAEC